MNRQGNTREQILHHAAHLLMTRGYSGFSYRDISTQLGVKNAAIHYHFPSKSDLAMALVQEYRQVLRDQTSEFMAYGGPALPQLEGLFRFTLLQCEQGRCICPIGAFSVDYEEIPDAVRKATDSFLGDSIKWLTRVLEAGREQGEFHFEGDAGAKAVSILASLQGARQMTRIHQRDLLEPVMQQIREELGIEH
jgi:TetR/AcrR family transcriptional repressor of nem operon